MTLAFAHRAVRKALVAGELLVLAWLFATEDLSELFFLILIIGAVLGVLAIVFRGLADWLFCRAGNRISYATIQRYAV